MKINERKKVNLLPLRAVQFGEAFEHEGNIFIKCLGFESNRETDIRIGMNIDTGRLCYFDAEELIGKLDAEIIINK